MPSVCAQARASSASPWSVLYLGEPMPSVAVDLERTQTYWRWQPSLCRLWSLASQIRIEVDTVGVADWNYIDCAWPSTPQPSG